MPRLVRRSTPAREIPNHARPTRRVNPSIATSLLPDPVVQRFTGTPLVPGSSRSFDGLDNASGVLPPDTNGDVGPHHFFQTVNLSLAIYSKGTATTPPALLYGPFGGSTLWNGFGGPCETHNNGDPVVMYDHLADRWFMSQLALPNLWFGLAIGPFYQCIAVSTTPDPTGSYHRYQFAFDKLNDYPKFGVWPDAYYMTINQFASGTLQWAGQGVIAIDRARMLAGQPASIVYFDLSSTDPNLAGMLPADLDGPAPPAGSPGYFVQMDDDAWGYSADQLQLWRFHVDWTNPSASTFTGPNLLATAAFDADLCGSTPCVRQPGTAARLHALADRLMYRLQYRNFGTHESLVVNQTVDADGQDHAGIRWYEVRNPRGAPFIHQQGTYAPDTDDRSVGSAAMDRVGNLAVGFTASGISTYPSIRYAGRLAADAPGVLTQGEADLMAGSGSQTHESGRWGDYSALLVDPSDGCTFWYTSQYYAVTSEMAWRTRIGSFAFPSCTSASGLPVVTVTATTAAVSEAGPGAGRFTFSRTGNMTASLTVRYTVNGTATADADYAALPETVTIPPGSPGATLDVTAIDDSFAEGSETVVVALDANESYAIGAPAGGIVTIASDDAPGDLVVSALTPPAVGGAGGTMMVTDVTRNQGAGVADASSTGLYLSQSASLTGGAVLMGTRAVPSMAAAGADTASTSVTVPPGTATGVYYVIAKADVNAAVLEAQEGNNTRSAVVRIGPDLVVAALAVPSNAAAGSVIAASDTTTNTGGGNAGASVTRFYLSTNASFGQDDVLLGSRTVGPLAAAASTVSSSSPLTIPANTPGGTYYVVATADADKQVVETSETNNARPSGSIAIGADLNVPTLTAPATAGAGVPFTLTDTTANSGAGSAAASQTSFYLSTNSTFDTADVLLGARPVSPLQAGAVSSGATTVTIPTGAATGTYYVVARADAGSVVAEGSETNNTRAVIVRLGPDLTIAALAPPATAAAGSPVSISDTTTNTGGGAAAASATRYYLSANTALDAGDALLGSRAVPALPAGASHSASILATVPATTAGGAYYVIAQADAGGNVIETVETNNTRTAGLVRIGADLTVALVTPPPAGAGGFVAVADTTKNVGIAAADATSTALYLSANAVLDAADVLLGSHPVPPLDPTDTYTASTAVQVPAATLTGTYYVLAVADAGSGVAEANETNNRAAAVIRVGPDLIASALAAPSSAVSGAAITVTDTVRNQGGGAAGGSATRFYLSTNGSFDTSDTLLASRPVGPLEPGATDSGPIQVTLPAGLPTASFYLIAVADGEAQVTETVEGNNSRAVLVRVTAAP